MNHTGRPPLPHPLAPLFNRAVDSICAALGPSSLSSYQLIVRNFLSYLGAAHRELKSIEQLHREPHLLGWMSRLRSQVPPLATSSYIYRLSGLRTLLVELAWTEQLPQLARLIRREDIPRRPHRLARPLTAQQDQLLQQEFLKRNDLGGNVFLLIRHTGMRIGECADLSFDCLRSTGPNQWAILVPLGKLKTERMVPVDSSVVTVIQRLRFYRSLDPQRPDGRLLARRSSRDALIRQLRNYLHRVCHSLEISARIVPHQFRHTYATEMLRAGVSLPSVMKLLGHASPEHDNDLCRSGDGRSSEGVSTGSFKTSASGSPAENARCPHSNWLGWGHRFIASHSTCTGDVPASAADWCCTELSRPALQSPNQDNHRSPQTPHALKTGRDWPVKHASGKLMYLYKGLNIHLTP